MGWASWNSFASVIDYDTIKAQADVLVSTTSTARAPRSALHRAGKNGCGYCYPTPDAVPNTGMEGHNQQDLAASFQNWGFGFVKVDWCGGDAEGLDQETT